VVRDANKRLDDERKVAEEACFALNGKRKKIPKRYRKDLEVEKSKRLKRFYLNMRI